MKVLILTPAWPPLAAGESDLSWRLAAQLSETGMEVHVISSRQAGLGVPEGVCLHPAVSRWSWFDMVTLVRKIKRIRPEAVLLVFERSLYGNHPMIAFLPAILKKCGIETRFITLWQNQYGLNLNKQKWRTKIIARLCAAGLGISDWPAFQSLRRDSDRHIMYCRHHQELLTLDDESLRKKSSVLTLPPLETLSPRIGPEEKLRLRMQLQIPESEKIIAYFGRIYSGKGLETLLEAFRIVRDKIPARLLMIGGGLFIQGKHFMEELKSLGRELEIDADIRWSGEYKMDSALPAEWLQIADAAVLPYDTGVTFSRSSLAVPLAYGLPVISTEGEGIESELKEALHLCPPRNAQALAQSIVEVLESPQRQFHLIENAKKIAAYYSWGNFTTRLIKILKLKDSHCEPEGRSNLVFPARGGSAFGGKSGIASYLPSLNSINGR